MSSYQDIVDTVYLPNVDLSQYSTMKLKLKGDVVIVKSITALSNLLIYCKKNHQKFRMVGWGANQILRELKNEFYLKLDLPLEENLLSEVKNEYHLPASLGLNQLTAHALKFGTKGWEALTGIPASLGGAIYMNAGTRLGEIKDLIISVDVMKSDGSLYRHQVNSESFSYRKNHFVQPGEVIVAATIKHLGLDPKVPELINGYINYRKQTQPVSAKTCGCVFKNYSAKLPAGLAIDYLGLGGFKFGDLEISAKHANFFINLGQATEVDFLELVTFVQDLLLRYYFSEFELEVKV